MVMGESSVRGEPRVARLPTWAPLMYRVCRLSLEKVAATWVQVLSGAKAPLTLYRFGDDGP